MAIVLNTIKEALDFIDGFDGYGMVSEDEDLQVEELLKLDLIDDYTPEAKQEYLDYLTSHIKLKDILILAQAQYNVFRLEDISYFDLKEFSEEFGY